MRRRTKPLLFIILGIIGIILIPALPGAGEVLQAQNLSITQIDPSSLLLTQEVDLYLSVTDAGGNTITGLKKDRFSVYESPEAGDYIPVPELIRLEEKPNVEEGIHILLLLDNSGSMYDTLAGTPAEDPSNMRISHAKNAVRRFAGASINPRDVVSLASFNTDMTMHSAAVKDPSSLEGLLTAIYRPEEEDAYTELYHSLADVSEDLARYRGRKVVVVLSDGENYPYYTQTGQLHPQYGRETLTPEEVVRAYQTEGITLYAIHFGIEQDRFLGDIAERTGGNVYDARNEEELTSVYRDIKEKIENEYRLTYRATMLPSERKRVKVVFERGKETGTVERDYFTGTMFGIPLAPYPFWILFFIPGGLLLWLLLLFLRYHKLRKNPALDVLQRGYRTKVSAKTIPLTHNKTVIGGSEGADLTLSGAASVKSEHVTILRDEKTGSYTLAGEGNVTVNNREIKGNRKLSDGDVIGIEGTTIVFDSGTEGE